MNKTIAHVVALVISPLITAFLFFAIFVDLAGGATSMGFHIFVLLGAILASYIGALFIGLPITLFLKNKGKISFLLLAVIGFVLGVLIYAPVEISYGMEKVSAGSREHILTYTAFKKILAAGFSAATGAIAYGFISGIVGDWGKSALRSTSGRYRQTISSTIKYFVRIYKSDRG